MSGLLFHIIEQKPKKTMGFLSGLFQARSKPDYSTLLAQGAQIIDVRSPSEYAGGHIEGSVNIPLDQLRAHLPRLKAQHKPIITCCRSGMRSESARQVLSQAGIEVVNGGAWDSLKRHIA